MASSVQLLKLAAEALDNGEDPFSGAFLREHDVSSGQCIDLAQHLAMGARIMARALTPVPGPPGPELLAMVAVIDREG